MKEKGMIGKRVQKVEAELKNFIRDGICQLKIGFNKNESCLESCLFGLLNKQERADGMRLII